MFSCICVARSENTNARLEMQRLLERLAGQVPRQPELAEQHDIPQRRVCYRRKQALRQMKEGLSDVPFMSIRPETRFLVYNSIVAHDKIDSVRAQPGGEEGD